MQDNYYSKVLCEDDICPYIDTVIGNNLILKNKNNVWIYDYMDDVIINDKYVDYRHIGEDMYIVNDMNGNYGIIDIKDGVLVELKYKYIDDYKDGIISYIDNNLYGIISVDNTYNIEPIYEDVVLVNNKIFAGKKDNVYQMHSYEDIDSDNSNQYNFVYVYNDVILVIKDKKIDILNTNLNSVLLMKINTFYEYTTGQERDSLNVHSDGDFIYFNVFINEEEYTTYKYSIKEKKLIKK